MRNKPIAYNRTMRFRLGVLVALVTFAVAGFAAAAWAADMQYGGEWCGHSKSNRLIHSPGLSVWTGEQWGIETAESKTDPWRLFNVHCVSFSEVVKGKYHNESSCTFTDPDGDTITGGATSGPGQPNVWTFLAGTGKWKGIQGHGTFKVMPTHKHFPDGSGAFCLEHHGTYTLP